MIASIQNSFTSLIRAANSSYCLVCLVKSNIVFSFKLVRFRLGTFCVVYHTIVALQHNYVLLKFHALFCYKSLIYKIFLPRYLENMTGGVGIVKMFGARYFGLFGQL